MRIIFNADWESIQGILQGLSRWLRFRCCEQESKEDLEKIVSKNAIPGAAANKTEGSGIGCLLLLILFGAGGYALWNAVDEYGYIPHNKLAIVRAKNWSIGEYKTCTSPNIAETRDEPQIDCAFYTEFEEPKKFEVRFYGRTFREDLKNVGFSWRCKKNEGTDPTFTCDEQKIVKWEEKN